MHGGLPADSPPRRYTAKSCAGTEPFQVARPGGHRRQRSISAAAKFAWLRASSVLIQFSFEIHVHITSTDRKAAGGQHCHHLCSALRLGQQRRPRRIVVVTFDQCRHLAQFGNHTIIVQAPSIRGKNIGVIRVDSLAIVGQFVSSDSVTPGS